jgi:hypothetical protein
MGQAGAGPKWWLNDDTGQNDLNEMIGEVMILIAGLGGPPH